MGCSSSKSVAATQLVDGPPGTTDSSTLPALSVRSAPSPTARSARAGSPPGGAPQATPILLLPRAAAGDMTVALALRTKQRHGAIVAENSSQLMEASGQHKRQVPKDPAVHAFLVQALQGNMFFGALGDSELAEVASAMECEHLAAGAVLMRQGEAGDSMYAIETGRLEIVMNGAKVGEFGEGTPGRVVGELAVLFSSPRSATVRAATNARVWRIDRAAFRALTAAGQEREHATLLAALRRGILETLEEAQLSKVASAAFRVRFAAGEQIIRKGEPGEVFYIIESGSVICRDLPGEQRDNILSAGDYFGERALVKREARACNVYAAGGGSAGAGAGAGAGASLIALHRDDFEALLGHLRDLLEHNAGMRLLLCVPILCDLSEEDRGALFRSLKLLSYKPGQLLCAENMAVSQFFIIKEGRVEVRCAGGAGGAGAGAPRGALAAKLTRASSRVLEGEAGVGAGAGSGAGAVGVDDATAAAAAATGELLGVLGSGQWFGEGVRVFQFLPPLPLASPSASPSVCLPTILT
jgi:cAMP-dependent protein kinase regulator